MHLLAGILLGALNVLVALSVGYASLPRAINQPNAENLIAFFLGLAPFAATALFAFGMKTKVVWLTALVLNALLALGTLAFILYLGGPTSRGTGAAFVVTLAVSGAVATLNVAYLLWRTPRTGVMPQAGERATTEATP